MTKEPLVSIIIVNWNGGKIFEECLKSLAKIDYKNYELIVVDNASTEKLPKTLKYKLIQNNSNTGFAPANNQGVKIAKGKYILLLNNDTKVAKNFLSILVEKMESDLTIGVIQPKIYMMDNQKHLDNVGSFFTKTGFLVHLGYGEKDNKKFDKELEVFSVKGACMLVRKEIIDKVGLFDAEFVSYFEETDFCWRVWLLGFRCIFYPATYIYHKVGFTSKRLEVITVNYHSLKNRIATLIKNLNTRNLFLILPLHLTILKTLMFYHLCKLEFKKANMYWDAVIWNISNIKKTLQKRRTVQKNRKVSDSFIFKKVGRKFDILEMVKHFLKVEKNFQ